MKIVRSFAAVGLLTAAAFCVSAQQQRPAQPRPTTPAAPPATTPQSSASVAVPDSKMAMLYSDAFLDPKNGIAKYNTVAGTLNREFQPREAELQALQTRITTLNKEIEDTQNVADPNAIRQKRDQLVQMQTELKRKGEDAQALYTKRRQEIFLPLQTEIQKALEAFAKARGITVIVDGSQVPVIYA